MDDLAGHADWVGKRWADTVTEESRPKVAMLIADAASQQEPRWRHLNHPAERSGADVPILYAAVRAGDAGPDRRVRPRSARGFVVAAPAGRRPAVDGAGLCPHPPCRDTLPAAVPDGLRRGADRGRRGAARCWTATPPPAGCSPDAAEPGPAWPLAQRIHPGHRPRGRSAAGRRPGIGRADDVQARLREGEQEVVVTASLFRDEGGVACLVRIAAPTGAPAPMRCRS